MLQSSEAANCSRRELSTKAARTAAGDHSSGSEDEGNARSEASIDSQCASIRVATVYAVSEGDDFYALAGSCEYTRGQFMSDAKAEKAAKTSLITGLTLGELKDKVVEQAEEIVEQAEEIAMLKRTSEWVWDKLKSAEASCTCKRPKPIPVESEDEEKCNNICGVLPLSAHGSRHVHTTCTNVKLGRKYMHTKRTNAKAPHLRLHHTSLLSCTLSHLFKR